MKMCFYVFPPLKYQVICHISVLGFLMSHGLSFYLLKLCLFKEYNLKMELLNFWLTDHSQS